MAIDFPTSPTTGQTFTSGRVTYTWDGTKWTAIAANDKFATVTATSKTLAVNERCTVTASGQTITLPASPSAGDEVTITIGGTFLNTIINRNGLNIMSLAENMTIDKPNVSITLYYVDATRGWRIL